ncbi:MAG: TonB-dependent receptor [Bacteroidales bacterium]|nr:TonB-dependent receptor [Bacteroidales bacterium]
MKKAAFVLIWFYNNLFSQNDTIKLQEISIISSKIKEKILSINSYYRIITSNEINNLPYNSINEIIEHISSIDVRQRGINGVQADISYRGSSYEQILILIDGSPVNDAQTGHHNANIPIPLENIEYIEIFSGSSAYLYGNSAYAAVINIVTKNIIKNSFYFNTEAGDYKYLKQFVNVNYRYKNLIENISLNYKKSNGCYKNTDFTIKQFYWKQNYIKNNYSISMLNSFENKEFGAFNYYTYKYPYQFEKLYTLFSKIACNYIVNKVNLSTSINYRFSQDRFELFRENFSNIVIPSFYKNHNFHQSHSSNFNMLLNYKFKVGELKNSFNYYNNILFSNVLGSFINDTLYSFLDKDAFYNKRAKRTHYTLSSSFQYFTKKIEVGSGLIFIYLMNKLKIYPSADLSYKITPNTKVCFNYSYSYRLPTYTELYYIDPSHYGNSHLKPENSNNIELGLKSIYTQVEFNLFFFYNKSENSIDWVKNNLNEKWHTENILKLIRSGLCIDFNYSLSGICKKVNIGYIYNKIKSYTSYHYSKYICDIPRNKLSFSMDFMPIKKVTFNITSNYIDRQGQYVDPFTGTQKNYANYLTIDSYLGYSIYDKISIYITIINVLNTKYFEYSGVAGPKRWFLIGFKGELK